MADKKLNPKPFFIIGIIAVIAAGGWFILGSGGPAHNYYDFAACLADEGATMYGFDACPHCIKQKAIIGNEAFKQELDNKGYYVRCRPTSEATQELGGRVNRISSVEPMQPTTTQGDACSINVGAGTPTWVINGEKYVGEQTIADLANATGCPLPDEYTGTGEEDVGGYTPEGQ